MSGRRKVLTRCKLGDSGWIVTILSATFCVFAGMVSVTRKTPAPYELKYPANFGSRFTIPADNPTTQEKLDIIAFFGMLTDSTFITNPAFSNPHSISKAQ